ncbi:hypothetical protein HUU53_02915 [Candidatus Micrarchaeota archaeon]|nr:hypothetical protein [Candidatus Micrarchaeota archaeon]
MLIYKRLPQEFTDVNTLRELDDEEIRKGVRKAAIDVSTRHLVQGASVYLNLKGERKRKFSQAIMKGKQYFHRFREITPDDVKNAGRPLENYFSARELKKFEQYLELAGSNPKQVEIVTQARIITNTLIALK